MQHKFRHEIWTDFQSGLIPFIPCTLQLFVTSSKIWIRSFYTRVFYFPNKFCFWDYTQVPVLLKRLEDRWIATVPSCEIFNLNSSISFQDIHSQQ